MPKKSVVFFDIGDTLGAVTLSDGTPSVRLTPFSHVPGILDDLRGKKYRLGVISNTENMAAAEVDAMLREAGLLSYFEPALRIYSSVVKKKKDSPAIFKLAARKAGLNAHPSSCLFVGEDAKERSFAQAAGWKVAPAAALVAEVLAGQALRFVRVHVPSDHGQSAWREALRRPDLPLVPLHVSGRDGRDIYAIASIKATASLDNMGFRVDRLGPVGAPNAADLYILRDDRQKRTGFLVADGQSETLLEEDRPDQPEVVTSTSEGLFVIVPGTRNVNEFHFKEARHGHTVKLIPNPSLLRPVGRPPSVRALTGAPTAALAERDLKPGEISILNQIDSRMIQEFVDRYSGATPLSRGKTIRSRHCHHPDNALAVDALVADLRRLGGGKYTVGTHPFQGRSMRNVIAEFPGETSELVLITAHMDSTGQQSEGGYAEHSDPAPGADDDGSGIAAVLAAASIFPKLAQGARPRRTVRFVLFNAEEIGLVGSKHYAIFQADNDAPIVAVLQMDMVGYLKPESQAPHPFEIHLGYASEPDVVQRSRLIANRIDRARTQVSRTLQPAQMYEDQDPADGHSDHSSFHLQGYAAVCVSEDAFTGGPSTTGWKIENPHYHKNTDRTISAAYAAEVARAVAAAAWLTAQP